MSGKKKQPYLMNRMQTLTLSAILGFVVLLVLFLLLCIRSGLSPVLALVGLAGVAVWAAYWAYRVVRPLRRREDEIIRMLRGYGDPEVEQLIPIDREDEMLFQQVKEWLNPSRAFQMNKRQQKQRLVAIFPQNCHQSGRGDETARPFPTRRC